MSSPQRIAASQANGKLGGAPKKQYDWKLNRTEEILSLSRAGFGFKRIAATLKIRERLMLRKYLKELGIAAQPNNANHWLTSHCGTPIKELHLAAKLEREHDGWWLEAHDFSRERNAEKSRASYYLNHAANKQRSRVNDKRRYYMYRDEPWFKAKQLARNQVARIARSVRSFKKDRGTRDLLGCSYQQAAQWITDQLPSHWTWADYGKLWEIDHILQLSDGFLTDKAHVSKVCYYTNLRPMACSANKSRSRGAFSRMQRPSLIHQDLVGGATLKLIS